MIETRMKLNTTGEVADFVTLCSKCIDDVLVYSGRYVVSGKSLMGMYSLDLTKSIGVEFCGDIPAEVRSGMDKSIVET